MIKTSTDRMGSPQQDSPEHVKVQRERRGNSSLREGECSTRPKPQTSPPSPAWDTGSLLSRHNTFFLVGNGSGMKPDILHDSPDNRQTAHLCGEGINLIGALSDSADKALDGIGGLNVAMHGRGKGVQRQQRLFIRHQAVYRFRVTLSIFGFECIQVGQRILLLLLRARCL